MTWIIWATCLGSVFAIMFAFHFAFLYRHLMGLWKCAHEYTVDQASEIDRLAGDLQDEIVTSAEYEARWRESLDMARKYRSEMDRHVDTENFWRGKDDVN